jgi:hypothetical protein
MEVAHSVSYPIQDFDVEISSPTTVQNMLDGYLNTDPKNGNQSVRNIFNPYLL